MAPAGCPTYAPAGPFDWRGRARHLRAGEQLRAHPGGCRAIRYAFAHLGAAYSQSNRDGEPLGVRLLVDGGSCLPRGRRQDQELSHRIGLPSFYLMMGWTGAYIPSYYSGTNLTRV